MAHLVVGVARVPIKDLKRRYLKGVEDGLDEVAYLFLGEANGVIQQESTDTGKLVRSGKVRKDGPGARVILWDAPHAAPVHYGSRPHWPPLEPIIGWVRRNVVRLTMTTGQSQDVLKPNAGQAERGRRTPKNEVLRIARAIQAKIAREGTPAVAWVPRAWSRVKPKSAAMLQRAIDEALE